MGYIILDDGVGTYDGFHVFRCIAKDQTPIIDTNFVDTAQQVDPVRR